MNIKILFKYDINLNKIYKYKYNTEMYIRQRNDTLKVNDFKYFIVDTDCGGDDSQALIVADYFARTTNKTLLGITCCNGNAFIADVATNVLIVQALCGSNYPVYLGNDYSMGG